MITDGSMGNLRPWQPGQSGNPKGRPKVESQVQLLARTYTQEAIEKLIEWMRSDNPKASVAACQAILDRAWGKPVQAVEVKDSEGMPVGLAVIFNGHADSRVPAETRMPLLS